MKPDHFERLDSCCRCRYYEIGSRTCVKHEFYVGVKTAKNHICKNYKDIALGSQSLENIVITSITFEHQPRNP